MLISSCACHFMKSLFPSVMMHSSKNRHLTKLPSWWILTLSIQTWDRGITPDTEIAPLEGRKSKIAQNDAGTLILPPRSVHVATGWVLAQSIIPKSITYPSTSNLFNTTQANKHFLQVQDAWIQTHNSTINKFTLSTAKENFDTVILCYWKESDTAFMSCTTKVSELKGRWAWGEELGSKRNFPTNAP